ncbi:transcription termination factor 2 [Scaptodrosophila lebanonensis]|uniref:Transcription termination factor 2 n=1 Tax=Drosophila lebanonensis TaxID=7225 RepID=A0A6J2TGB0_DROLE|nr:transcription termination factor 2 [Scaptodrosophila lebanonensis]
MSSEDEYFTSEEESVISASTGRSGRSSRSSRRSVNDNGASNVTVGDTESEEESLRPARRQNQKSRRPAIASDSEEDELDARALSPTTRMSITGVRPQDLSDDSSEIDYSDEERPARNSNAVRRPTLAVMQEEDDEQYKTDEAEETFNEAAEAAAARYRAATSDEALSPRYSTVFANNIEESLHSTLFPITQAPHSLDESNGSDVLILSNKETPIEISSTDSDRSYNKENISAPPFARKSTRSPRNSAGQVPAVKSTKNLLQPTIQPYIQNPKPRTSSEPQRRSRIKKEDEPQFVDKDVYEQELRTIAKMRVEQAEAERLYNMVAHKLSDKGSQIKKRIDGLRRDIYAKEAYMSGLKVKEEPNSSKPRRMRSSGSSPQPRQPPAAAPPRKPETGAPSWDDISAAVHQIQPTHTGAKGMATFNTQKALTLDRLKDLHGSLKGCPSEKVLADDPKGLKVTLMDHQKHALAWMEWREQQNPRGGILADDMGLGKTLTMISSVLACKNRREAGAGANSSNSDSEGERRDKRKSGGSWISKGSRKESYKGGTLVVCPASLLLQWEGEVGSKVSRNKLTVCVHHGNNRETKAKHLRTYDIVVTTYNIVAREHKAVHGALFGLKWHRIILDEAHVVRNHKAQSSVAVSELLGKYRWALTGTPIQNKELDVYALLKFLRCSPFDDLVTWKKWIDNKSAGGQQRLNTLMKTIMLRRTKAQLQLEGKLDNLPNKEMRLIEVTLDTDEMNVYQKIMTYSRTLFAQFLFQRAEKDSDLNFINDANKPTYSQIKDPNGAYYKMHEKFSRMYHGDKEVKSHDILVLLLRLRQICCHPGLIDAMLEGSESLGGDESDAESPEIDLLDQLNKLAINDSSQSSRRSRGSSGGDEARIAKASKNVLKRTNPVFDLKRPSTKMLKVMDILKSNVLKSKDKAIIVSQWTSVLDLLRDHLEAAKISTLSLNGSIPVKHRQDIVNQFNDPKSSKRILLLSLTAGGVGLNLVGANHLLLIDLHWNPQLEAQAQDRIYRVGQKKNVIIYKFMCLDTVEQRIKALQDKKLELAEGVLTGAKVSSKLTIDDLKGLFGM